MASLPKPPLTDRDYAKLNETLAILDRARQEIDRAKEVGMPVAECDEACQARTEMLKKIKQVYFPERP